MMSEVVQASAQGEERLALTTEERLSAIEERLQRGSERMGVIERDLGANTAVTREIRDILELGRSGLRILGHLGTLARWVSYIAGAIGAVFGAAHAVRNGVPTDAVGEAIDAVVQAAREGVPK
jgi:hypothetical protein